MKPRVDGGADLRIEIRRAGPSVDIVAVDPVSQAECYIADSIDSAVIQKVNQYLWNQLERAVKKVPTDPNLYMRVGHDSLAELFNVGFAALLMLTENSSPGRVDDVQAFCRSRVRPTLRRSGPVSILHLVFERRDHIPFELMPLFGKPAREGGRVPTIEEFAELLPAFSVVCTHADLNTSTEPREQKPTRLSVRFFRNTSLVGSVKEYSHLSKLQRRGKVDLPILFPPKNFRRHNQFPELDIAERVADGWRHDTKRRADSPSQVCHFACHIVPSDDGSTLVLKANGLWAQKVSYRLDFISVAIQSTHLIPPAPMLCFLSACKSGATDAQLLTSAVTAFTWCRPQSIVGVLASVPDVAAAAVAARFYEELSEGTPIGLALRIARLHLLDPTTYNNPFGLLYISYFGEHRRIRTGADTIAKFIPTEEPTTIKGV